jgi:hypothetical protein
MIDLIKERNKDTLKNAKKQVDLIKERNKDTLKKAKKPNKIENVAGLV